MESIKELRKLCQSTRPSIFEDPLSRLYYKISIYFTWLCLIFRMSANQVTILSGIIAILGGFLISSESIYITLLGGLCFHLFAVLDMSDGEVARYRGQGGVEGHYLDWFMHFITPTALVMGLFLSSAVSLNSTGLLVIGLIGVVIPLLSKSVQNAGWTVIVWTILRDKKSGNLNTFKVSSINQTKKVRSRLYKLMRLIITSPFEDRWSSLLILILPILDLILVNLGFVFIDYKFFWLIYMGLVGPIYLFTKVRELMRYSSLLKGYNRLVDPSHKVVLPEDDFL